VEIVINITAHIDERSCAVITSMQTYESATTLHCELAIRLRAGIQAAFGVVFLLRVHNSPLITLIQRRQRWQRPWRTKAMTGR